MASALVAAAGLERDEALLIEVRGNHDTFDVYARGGRGDLYAAHAAAGRRNATALAAAARVGGGGAAGGPSVAIVSLDAARAPGIKRPANFAGVASPALRRELRAALRRTKGADAVLAFGHFPLSFLEGPRRAARASVAAALASHNASAYLCGHLHWRFGDRLHAWHGAPLPAPLLELEAGDWKEARAWRLLAFDADARNALSFRDFVFEPAAKKPPFVAMITSPPDARYAQPLRAPPAAQAPQARVKALVFPPRGVTARDLRVVAAALCGGAEMATAPMQPLGGEGPVWAGPAATGRRAGSPLPLEALERRCDAPGGLRVRVSVTLAASGAAAAADERPVLLRPAAAPMPMGTTPLATLLMAVDGPRLGTAVFVTTAAAHAALFLLAPPLAAAWARRRDAAAMPPQPPHVLLLPLLFALEPLRLLRAAAAALGRRPRLLAAHAAYCAYLAFGPWAVAELFSDPDAPKPGLIYALRLSAPGHNMPGMDAGFITGPSLILISAWAALVGAALAAADDAGAAAAASGGAAQAWSARLGAAAMLASRLRGGALCCAAAALLCGSGSAAYELRESYGDVAVQLSPGCAWVPFLAAAALRAGLAAPPPAKPQPVAAKKQR